MSQRGTETTVFEAQHDRQPVATFFSLAALREFAYTPEVRRRYGEGHWVSSPYFAPTVHGYAGEGRR